SYFSVIKDDIARFDGRIGFKDQMFFYTFGEEVTLVLDGGHDRTTTADVLKGIKNTDKTTHLFEALKVAGEMADQLSRDDFVRREFVVITDGEDFTTGATSYTEALAYLKERSIPVHAFGNANAKRTDLNTLGEFARQTGGSLTIFEASDFWTSLAAMETQVQDSDVLTFRAESNQVSNRVENLVMRLKDGTELTKDILVSKWMPDTEAPTVEALEDAGDGRLRLVFSEKVSGMGEVSNYALTLNGAPQAVTAVTLDPDTSNAVLLTVGAGSLLGDWTVACVGMEDISMEKNPVVSPAQFVVLPAGSETELGGLLGTGTAAAETSPGEVAETEEADPTIIEEIVSRVQSDESGMAKYLIFAGIGLLVLIIIIAVVLIARRSGDDDDDDDDEYEGAGAVAAYGGVQAGGQGQPGVYGAQGGARGQQGAYYGVGQGQPGVYGAQAGGQGQQGAYGGAGQGQQGAYYGAGQGQPGAYGAQAGGQGQQGAYYGADAGQQGAYYGAGQGQQGLPAAGGMAQGRSRAAGANKGAQRGVAAHGGGATPVVLDGGQSGRKLELIAKEADGQPKELEFRVSGPFTIGRAGGNDLVIRHSAVSKEHCVIQWGTQGKETQGWYLTDLQTTNGTFVNGARVTGSRLLEKGDKIQVANTLLTLR
ncbi:MAG: FHA domain-containing protein, partial [Lachnospiraceae bacterium]|nr:FHA domain-containing protein [Lachnospiraceae bacterium]